MHDLTVKQLVDLLKTFPDDATVYVHWEQFANSPIEDIQYDPERNEVAIEHDN